MRQPCSGTLVTTEPARVGSAPLAPASPEFLGGLGWATGEIDPVREEHPVRRYPREVGRRIGTDPYLGSLQRADTGVHKGEHDVALTLHLETQRPQALLEPIDPVHQATGVEPVKMEM